MPDADLGLQRVGIGDRLAKPHQTALAVIKASVAQGIAAFHGYWVSIEPYEE
jgi:hypothetical protein